ncbi:hypothetical protein T10_3784 [Trichinella papuae]|uniref:Uncharacterized protein n=1 Tax=Trichinella papuae TaxID=268474 RepID=A0A0V1MQC6_9BILA|nr:hypothetical protein T10_3784 [Trichinella papuae]
MLRAKNLILMKHGIRIEFWNLGCSRRRNWWDTPSFKQHLHLVEDVRRCRAYTTMCVALHSTTAYSSLRGKEAMGKSKVSQVAATLCKRATPALKQGRRPVNEVTVAAPETGSTSK